MFHTGLVLLAYSNICWIWRSAIWWLIWSALNTMEAVWDGAFGAEPFLTTDMTASEWLYLSEKSLQSVVEINQSLLLGLPVAILGCLNAAVSPLHWHCSAHLEALHFYENLILTMLFFICKWQSFLLCHVFFQTPAGQGAAVGLAQ